MTIEHAVGNGIIWPDAVLPYGLISVHLEFWQAGVRIYSDPYFVSSLSKLYVWD